MSKLPSRTVVHLVHGTWANGWMKSKDAWFKSTSPLCKRLSELSADEVELKPFFWSGRNSVTAREEAASQLAAEIVASDSSDVKQIIIAHSHGGTLAFDAIGKVEAHRTKNRSLKALICMGTPFVSISEISVDRYMSNLLVIAGFLDALLWTCVLGWKPSVIDAKQFYILFPILTLITILLFKKLFRAPINNKIESNPGSPTVPTYLLRATRDEAALSLGLMQTINLILSSFSLRTELYSLSLKQPLKIFVFASVYISCILLGFIAAPYANRFFDGKLSGDGLLNLGLIYSYGVAGVVYILGYGLLALSAGHFQISRWPGFKIEVDAAPPGHFCTIKVYSVLGEFSGLRHGLHMSNDVVDDVVEIVKKAAK